MLNECKKVKICSCYNPFVRALSNYSVSILVHRNEMSMPAKTHKQSYCYPPYLHFVRLFWNHVLTCASVILSVLASAALSVEARYFCLWKRFSSSQIWMREKEVRGFFRLGGVLFWYGWPILRGGAGQGPKHIGGTCGCCC